MGDKKPIVGQAGETVHRGYETWSPTYDQQANPTRDLSTAVLRHFLTDLSGKVVVEAGCGTGRNTQWLAPMCHEIIGLDFSDGMLAQARQKPGLEKVRFIQHDLLQPWPIEPETADLVLINLVIEHIPDLETLLSHANSALRPGGQILITEYHPDRVSQGTGAQIEIDGQETIHIVNYHHPVLEYMSLGDKLGLDVTGVKGWREELEADGTPVATGFNPLIMTLFLKKEE